MPVIVANLVRLSATIVKMIAMTKKVLMIMICKKIGTFLSCFSIEMGNVKHGMNSPTICFY